MTALFGESAKVVFAGFHEELGAVAAGLLSNAPGYATDLAAGRPVRVARHRTAD